MQDGQHSQSDTSITAANIIARAEDLARRLTAQGAAAEQAGRLSDETIADVVAADLMRLNVPKRYGGLELPYPVTPQVSRRLGRGCLATSWTIGILIQHNYQLAFWPRQAQDEFWSRGPNAFAPGFIVPGGLARRVDEGFKLTGQWRMASGYPHADWILLGAHEDLGEGKRGALLRFALPVAEAPGQNNWQISGLAATGTWDLRLDGARVPAHRSFAAASMLDGTATGARDNPGPLWRIPLLSFYYPNMAAMMLGAAEGVAAIVTERTKSRVLSYGGIKAAELATVQSRIGAAHARLSGLAALLDAECNRIWQTALAGQPFTMEARAAVRANGTLIAKQSREIACDLIDFAGTGSFMLDQPLQRFHREINVLASHAFYDWDRMTGVYGRVLLGQSVPDGELV